MSNPWVDSLIRVGTRLVSALKAGPPKNVFNPEYLTGNNFLKRFNEVKRAEGFGAAYNKTRMESTLRKGSFVGKDYNGNMYYEDKNAPYGRTRWVEYPTPKGIWAIEQNYDASMVSPEWHGWLHYTHDKPGNVLAAEHEKPFKMALPINQSMQRPEFGRESEFHQPPCTMAARIVRGKVGPKYESWSGSVQTTNPALRNYSDNEKTLHIP
ncbi:NADH dehydrogenase [Chrysochromulina tobinii]|uniref:NADH dehydrogenase [ubiquinone] 1 alpha subcomplex subunit 12 n=1 Tax=Chrysochromulina tobinii TaxID=1460289 RepID=A0A0M0J4P3_9EUKA|nr:NADH dehydrogenase [Chrysochromulina tobinii]|eukprot:KOO21531.1 NADH dehydrogenase [Chrysochromulina sp. CCMP291]